MNSIIRLHGPYPWTVRIVRRKRLWFRRREEVIHKQVIASMDAYIPPIPEDCGVRIEYADHTSNYFPPE